jgi:hypothetical protein
MKNMNDIRAMLCEEIQSLRDGKSDPKRVQAISSATSRILTSIKLELDYAKLQSRKPHVGFIQLTESAQISKPD